ncbi:translational activator of cytochrome c oxidase 1 [Cylas formicarius]|uniref:translational activator of cytochrome c oxidase 1 n=1 Tax=Cylas formicarius TaxID=197179 RepID=UPI002958CE7A|nr:translational activator of cytochrome c oxidase 1 [Cylas formicarius]
MLKKFLNLNIIIRRNAGHSKWQNIRHTKGAKDAERATMFTKLSRQMKVAIQEGGSADPQQNIKLSHVIEQAKRFNMPAASIQNVLKTTDKSNAKTFLIEIRGPGGCLILCEVFTSNLQGLRMTVASILKKHQAKLNDSGIGAQFTEKGITYVEPKDKDKSEEEILEAATEHAIECNAEDVQFVDKDILQFTCGATQFRPLQQKLEEFGYKIIDANIDFIPTKLQEISPSEQETTEKLLSKLETLPEIVRVFDNVSA